MQAHIHTLSPYPAKQKGSSEEVDEREGRGRGGVRERDSLNK